MLAAIVYVLGIFVAVLVLLLKKEDRFVRFHAAQAILLDLVIMAASLFLFVIGFGLIAVLGIATLGIGFIVGFWVVWVLMMVLGIGVFLLRLFMAWKAFSGERPGLPFIGEHADRIAMG